MSVEVYARQLEDVEDLLRLSLAVSATACRGEMLDYLASFTWGSHTDDDDELRLTGERESRAAALLEHCAVHLIAVQVDTALNSAA